MKPKLENL